MKKAFVILVVVVVLAAGGSSSASDKSDVMATIHQFVDGFNKGDVKAASATCAEQTSIIDEFPPYEWHGAGSCSTWMNDYDADAKKNEISGGIVTLSEPRHVDFAGEFAYVVVPGDYAYTKKGKGVKETGSMLVVALRKGQVGWRITGWSWAKH
jgi:ketosteroid isomerase-like protein